MLFNFWGIHLQGFSLRENLYGVLSSTNDTSQGRMIASGGQGPKTLFRPLKKEVAAIKVRFDLTRNNFDFKIFGAFPHPVQLGFWGLPGVVRVIHA